MGVVTTSHGNIFDFWKDRPLPFGTGEEPVVGDWGEPCCWGCGKPVNRPNDEHMLLKRCYRDGTVNFIHVWNDPSVKSKLERCHIVPAALGGPDTPANLFLLCSNCHLLSPDTTNRAAFFKWIHKRRQEYWYGKISVPALMRFVDEELQDRGLPPWRDMVNEIDPDLIDLGSLKEYANGHMGLHCTNMATSSLVVTLSDWLEKTWANRDTTE